MAPKMEWIRAHRTETVLIVLLVVAIVYAGIGLDVLMEPRTSSHGGGTSNKPPSNALPEKAHPVTSPPHPVPPVHPVPPPHPIPLPLAVPPHAMTPNATATAILEQPKHAEKGPGPKTTVSIKRMVDMDAECRSGGDPVRVAKLENVTLPVPHQGAAAYKLVSEKGDGCRYMIFDRPQIGTCLNKRWVVVVGSSNGMGISHGWAKLLLGEGQKKLYKKPSEPWTWWGKLKNPMRQTDMDVEVALDDQGNALCFRDYQSDECVAGATSDRAASWFTGTFSATNQEVIGSLKRLAKAGYRESRPPPEITLVTGIWVRACVGHQTWPKGRCTELEKRRQASGASTLAEQAANDVIDLLDYIHREWPEVTSVTAEDVYMHHEVKEHLVSKLASRAARRPELRFIYLSSMAWDMPAEEIKNSEHWFGRAAELIAQWHLNRLCPAANETSARPGFGDSNAMVFADTCRKGPATGFYARDIRIDRMTMCPYDIQDVRTGDVGGLCRSGLDPVSVVPVQDEADEDSSTGSGSSNATLYKLESAISEACVFTIFEQRDISACLDQRWVLNVGSGNATVVSHSLAGLMLGQEAKTAELADYLLSNGHPALERPVEVALDKHGEVLCHGKTKCKQRAATKDASSWFTGLPADTVADVKIQLEKEAAAGSRESRPAPEIIVTIGAVDAACLDGASNAHCAQLAKRQRESGARSAMEQLANDIVALLEYLAKDWQGVRHITLDKQELRHDLLTTVGLKLQDRPELPEVRVIDTHKIKWGFERELWHAGDLVYGRGALLLAQWHLNRLCAKTPEFGREKVLAVSDSCVQRPNSSHTGQEPCLYGVEIRKFRGVWAGALEAGLEADISAAVVEALVKPPDAVRDMQLLYRMLFASICGLFVVASAANVFNAPLFLAVVDRLGLLAPAERARGCWRQAVTDCLRALVGRSTNEHDSRYAYEQVSLHPPESAADIEAIVSSAIDGPGSEPNQPAECPADSETPEPAPKAHSSAAASPAAASPAAAKSKKMRALGMARYLASVHIVIGHLWNKDVNPDPDVRELPFPVLKTHRFGFTWVPWFVMLSAFVLTYARLNSSKPDATEPWPVFTWKRVRSIYPLYLTGLLARAAQRAVLTDHGFSLGSSPETLASLFLVQSWIPDLTEHVLQMHCWFLSCIVPYWALHQLMVRHLRRARTQVLVLGILLVAAMPLALLAYTPQAAGDPHWTSAYKYKGRNWESLLVVTLKFNPIGYWPVYLVGIASAILLHRVRRNPPFIVRNGAAIGYVLLFGIFALTARHPLPTYKLSFRMGLLAPIQALLLMGLALEQDPVARIFSLRVLQPFENLSYPQYVFQFIAFDLWQARAGLGFWVVLVALSIAGYYFVQSPLKSSRQPSSTQAWGVLNIGLLVGVVAIASHGLHDASKPITLPRASPVPDPLEAVVRLPGNVVDRSLSEAFSPLLAGAAPGTAVINPSLLWVPERREMWAAVRLHRLTMRRSRGFEDVVWESSSLVGRVDAKSFTPLETFRELDAGHPTGSWHSCSAREYMRVHANGTYSRTMATGPEDPRLLAVSAGKEIIVTSNLASPVPSNESSCDLANRMLLTTVPTVSAAALPPQCLLQLQQQDPLLGATTREKNWLAFEHEGEVKFVQSIIPFTVVAIEASGPGSGSGSPSQTSVRYESRVENPNLSRIAQATGAEFHGGTNAISYTREDGTQAYLAAFHTKHGDRYRNVLFEFRHSAKMDAWVIERISKPLDLVQAKPLPFYGVSQAMAFLSGLTVVDDGVLLSYGSSNLEARARLVPWDHLVSLWDAPPEK